MSKGPWEERTGWLFRPPDFVDSYKPVDSPMHGGAVRLDWHACDRNGFYWLVEVKQVDESAASINLLREVSALQRRKLNDNAKGQYSVPALVVGQGDCLYIWGWRRVQWLWRHQEGRQSKPELLSLLTASAIFHWTGKPQWISMPLYDVMMTEDDEGGVPRDRYESELTRLTPTVYSPMLPEPVPYASITKPEVCTLTRGKMQRSGPSSLGRAGRTSSSGSSRNGGMRR